jgi:hypothetical protein
MLEWNTVEYAFSVAKLRMFYSDFESIEDFDINSTAKQKIETLWKKIILLALALFRL